jgi:RNA polymerase-binding transcription factor DksA
MKHEESRQGSSKARRGITKQDLLGAAFARTDPASHVKLKWAWHFQTLLALRDRLLERRLARWEEVTQPLEPHSMHMADSATDELDHDLALTEISTEQDALYEVDAALRRILNGTYGVCEQTGQPIPGARLRAVPWTRFSREAEVRWEGQGMAGKTHLAPLRSAQPGAVRHLQESQNGDDSDPPPPEDESLRTVVKPPINRTSGSSPVQSVGAHSLMPASSRI